MLFRSDLWMKATAAGDVDTVLTLVTEDVVFMVAGQEPFGKDAFAKGMHNMAGQFRVNGTVEIEEIAVLGDWAYSRTHVTVLMEPLSGAPLVHRSGLVMTIWRKGPADTWRIARDANIMTTDPA